MSTIQAQADELRELAGDGGMEWVIGPIRVATLHGAADTILSLCDRVQELQAENAKLREDNACLVKAIEELHSVRLEDRLVTLENENDRLRELCAKQLDNLMPEICSKAWWCEGKDWHTCNDDACGNYTFVILARELGIEVG